MAGPRQFLVAAFNAAFYALGGLVPRSRRSWVFGQTREVFGGNPKYLFLWMAIHRPDIRVTWLTGSERTRAMLARHGYRVHRRWSPGGILAALRAGIFVFAHGVGNVNAQLSRGALQLNLWHGVGLKAIGRRWEKAGGFVARYRSLDRIARPDFVVTTSDFMQRHFADQLGLPPERCPQLGYSRLDCASDPKLAAAVEAIDRAEGFAFNPGDFAETYIYMPTYRDTGRPFLAEALPDLPRLSRILAGRNALLYVKPHPRTRADLPADLSNIRRWPDAFDFHPYLARLTGLITDYSSVLYDYLFLRDRGAILYTFDHDDYAANDRTLLYPFEENVAGTRVAAFDALCAVLADGSALTPDPEAARINARFWGGSARPASPAIVSFVEQPR